MSANAIKKEEVVEVVSFFLTQLFLKIIVITNSRIVSSGSVNLCKVSENTSFVGDGSITLRESLISCPHRSSDYGVEVGPD